jgi:peptidoglycan/xylan/chitin deacetylase (PgdA/CDA1 family)
MPTLRQFFRGFPTGTVHLLGVVLFGAIFLHRRPARQQERAAKAHQPAALPRSVWRRLARGLANGGLRLVGVLLIAAALAVPAYAYWHTTRPPYYGPAAQIAVSLPHEPQSLRQMPAYHDGVLVLCYHDLSPQPHNRYTVTPTVFAAQMAALRASGFHTISARKFAAFVQGKSASLPSRPVLITFDDGAKGTWIYADQILRRLSYQATVFLITGDVSHHQPYYLDWPEVEAMNNSGRWSFGSHTAEGHGLVASNNTGGTGPFLTNRMWLPAQHRLETLGEFQNRVEQDLDRSISEIEGHGLPRPLVFAYPFSATVEPTNDPVIVPILKRMLTDRFTALMDNTSTATLIRPGMRSPLPRVEVFHNTKPNTLLRRIRASIARSEAGRGR